MAVSTAQTSVETLKTALAGYVSSITHTDANTATLLQAQAQLALDNWENAKKAAANVAASAASNYSNGVGMSVNKRRVDQAEADADRYYADFVRACGMGGQTIPTIDAAGPAFYDLSTAGR